MKKVKSKFETFMLVLFIVISCINYFPAQKVHAVTSANLSISDKGVQLICSLEGFHKYCYKDNTQSSIGYGTKCTGSYQQPHTAGMHSITEAQAISDMKSQLKSTYEKRVRNQTSGITITQNQYDALVSLCYNTGGGTNIISNSPLIKYLRGTLSASEAKTQYAKYYITSGGVTLQGLINRRKKEAEYFFSNTVVTSSFTASETAITINMSKNESKTVRFTARNYDIGEFVMDNSNIINAQITKGFTITPENDGAYIELTFTGKQTGKQDFYVRVKDSNGKIVATTNMNITVIRDTESFTASVSSVILNLTKGETKTIRLTALNYADIGGFTCYVDENFVNLSGGSFQPLTNGAYTDVTFSAAKNGSGTFHAIVYDSNKKTLKELNIPVTVTSNTVTIHYNTNGGSIASDSNYYAASNGDIYKTSDKKIIASIWENGYKDPNGLYNATTFKLSRTGYQFLGWSLQKSGGKIYDQDDNTVSANDLFPDVKNKNGTVMLYAQWAKNTVTIHYNTNGGSIASDSNYYAASNGDIYKTSGKKIIASIWENVYKDPNGLYNATTFKLSRTGYQFLGWSLQKSGGKIYDQDDNTVSANDLFPQVTSKSGTVMLYAQWAKNFVTINYNANGGNVASDSDFYIGSNDDIYSKSNNKLMANKWENGYKGSNGLYNASTIKLTKPGYTFLGWSLQKSNGKIYDQDDNTISANDLFPQVTSKNGTVMLYAQWEKLPNITYSLKGDIDDNGKVNVSDLVMLQKWLINSGNLTDWKNADLYEDNIINVFDMVLLKRLIIKNQ